MKKLFLTVVFCAVACFLPEIHAAAVEGIVVKYPLNVRAYRTASVVASTLATGVVANLVTADQYISIIITGNAFRELYEKRGLEGRLLSRSVEDTATVTSVLVPWNSCGMTQSTVLGVATLTYLPYCLFNLISPLMSLLFAIVGYRIYRKASADETTL